MEWRGEGGAWWFPVLSERNVNVNVNVPSTFLQEERLPTTPTRKYLCSAVVLSARQR